MAEGGAGGGGLEEAVVRPQRQQPDPPAPRRRPALQRVTPGRHMDAGPVSESRGADARGSCDTRMLARRRLPPGQGFDAPAALLHAFQLFTAPQAAIYGRVDEDERAAEWETGKGSRPAAPRITCSWSTGAITSESSNNLFQLLGAFSHGISFVLSRPDGGRLDLRPSGITSIRLAHWRLALEHLSGQPQPTQGAASESRGAEARDRPLEHLLGQP